MHAYHINAHKETFPEDISIFSFVSKPWIMKTFHIHDDFEIYYCMQDNVKFLLPDKAYNLTTGDLLIFNNTDIHMSVVPHEVEYNRKIVQFKPECISLFSTPDIDLFECFLNRKPDFSHKIHLSNENRKEFLTIFGKMEQIDYKKYLQDRIESFGFNMYRKIYLIELLLLINKVYRGSNMTYENKHNSNYMKLRPILQYIHENCHLELTIDKLSNNFYISKPYIFALFKKVTGYTPNEYITKWRIARACELLKKENANVGATAEMAGFKDTSYFIRTFQRLVGVTPGQYIKHINNK